MLENIISTFITNLFKHIINYKYVITSSTVNFTMINPYASLANLANNK